MQEMDPKQMNPNQQFAEFRRLHQDQVDCFLRNDPDYLSIQQWYPLYKSYELFVEKYPTPFERAEEIERIRTHKIAAVKGLEWGELEMECLESTGHTLDGTSLKDLMLPSRSGNW